MLDEEREGIEAHWGLNGIGEDGVGTNAVAVGCYKRGGSGLIGFDASRRDSDTIKLGQGCPQRRK
jgi:hypothetical protein